MADAGGALLQGLPAPVATMLSRFVAAAREAFATDLRSIVLFGSAAEGKLTPTSDVNVVVVLHAFLPQEIDRLRDTFLEAEAAIKLRAMFLLEAEIAPASE